MVVHAFTIAQRRRLLQIELKEVKEHDCVDWTCRGMAPVEPLDVATVL